MIIQSRRVWVLNTWLALQIELENSKIVNLYPYKEKEVDIDYGDKRIVPGFIDVHTHGMMGFDTNDAQEEGLRHWMKEVTKEGVTSICPTTITQSEQVLTAALENVAKVVEKGYEGAEIVGIHFEGPYLDQVYKGAQPEQYCLTPIVEQFKRYENASNNLIKVVTMACEHDIDFELTKYCSQKGIVVSLGHSSATFEQAGLAIAHGARSMTHVYNGMTPFLHRKPGLVGAAFCYKDVYGEIIADGNHSTLESLRLFFQTKGEDFGVLVTDSLMVKGLPAGTQVPFGGQMIELYPDGSAHLLSTKGLAGSTLRVNKGLEILVQQAQVPWQAAINACTINPARMLKIDDRKGSIQAGKDADIVVLNDDFSIEVTYARGVAYSHA